MTLGFLCQCDLWQVGQAEAPVVARAAPPNAGVHNISYKPPLSWNLPWQPPVEALPPAPFGMAAQVNMSSTSFEPALASPLSFGFPWQPPVEVLPPAAFGMPAQIAMSKASLGPTLASPSRKHPHAPAALGTSAGDAPGNCASMLFGTSVVQARAISFGGRDDLMFVFGVRLLLTPLSVTVGASG